MCEPAGMVPPAPACAPDPVAVSADGDGGSCPKLVELLDLLQAITTATARVVELAGELETSGAAAEQAGVPLELVLGVDGRQTRGDRKMLLTAADVLSSMPATMGLFRAGRLSWGQVRAIVTACKRIPLAQRGEIDQTIAADVELFARAEPDDLTWHIDLLAARELPDPAADDRPLSRGDFVALQPRLDGGGTGYFEYADPIAFADVAERLDADAKRLLADSDVTLPATRPGDHDANRMAASTLGQARAAALHQLALGTAGAAGGAAADNAVGAQAADIAGRGASGAPSAPVRLHAVVPLASLLNADRTPGWLLTSLTGGHLRLTATAARRLVDERGADLRAIVIDDTGQALGVGRRTRIPPGWLRDTLAALDPTCTAPGCRTAARVGQADHATAWVPGEGHRRDGPSAVGGRTDVDNLHVACQTHNLDKQRRLWDVDIGPDGTRTWRHRRTGWTATRLPATRAFATGPPIRPAMPPRPDPPGDPPDP